MARVVESSLKKCSPTKKCSPRRGTTEQKKRTERRLSGIVYVWLFLFRKFESILEAYKISDNRPHQHSPCFDYTERSEQTVSMYGALPN